MRILKRASAKNSINLFSANLQKQSMNISLSGKEIKLLSVFPAEGFHVDAKLFQELQRHHKFPFEVVYLVMDPGYNERNRQIIEQNAKILKHSADDF